MIVVGDSVVIKVRKQNCKLSKGTTAMRFCGTGYGYNRVLGIRRLCLLLVVN